MFSLLVGKIGETFIETWVSYQAYKHRCYKPFHSIFAHACKSEVEHYFSYFQITVIFSCNQSEGLSWKNQLSSWSHGSRGISREPFRLWLANCPTGTPRRGFVLWPSIRDDPPPTPSASSFFLVWLFTLCEHGWCFLSESRSECRKSIVAAVLQEIFLYSASSSFMTWSVTLRNSTVGSATKMPLT